MADFATIDELTALWRPMSLEEQTRAEALLPVVSDLLRIEAEKVGIDLEQRASDSPSYSTVLKSVTVDIVARTLMTPTDKEPMVQESQSALGYSWSGTFLSPGGGLFIKNDELKRLGLKKQSIRGLEFYDTNPWPENYFD